MTETPPEMWWPSPESFEDLEVTDIETGWQLSAPDETELGAWLSYWSQDKEHHAFFEKNFLEVILQHALETLEQHGKAEDLSDGSQGNPEQAEENIHRVQPEY